MASTNKEFQRDYKTGRNAEELFEGYLKSEYQCKTELSPDKFFPFWDVSTSASTGAVIKYEVKYNSLYTDKDFPAGTVVIETGKIQNDKHIVSGLGLSTSDYYAFVIEGSDLFRIIPTDTLKRLCNDDSITQKKILVTKGNFIIQIFDKDFIFRYSLVI